MMIMSAANKALGMEDGVTVHDVPPPAYLDWLSSTNAFFDGPVWGKVLQEGFLAQRYYVWDQRFDVGHALTIFKKGPLKFGYLGFPICCAANTLAPVPYPLERMINAVATMRPKPQLVRIANSPFGQQHIDASRGPSKCVVESCITDLALWRADSSSVRRRDMRRARKHCVGIEFQHFATGHDLFALYAEAVRRNRGHIRYTKSYFNALSGLLSSASVNLTALRDNIGLACMAITAQHGDTTYYLHGGGRPEALRSGANDLVMAPAIEHAQAAGVSRFNFLSSPRNQPGLVRFKEKWGGVSREGNTITCPMDRAGRLVVKWILRSERELPSRPF